MTPHAITDHAAERYRERFGGSRHRLLKRLAKAKPARPAKGREFKASDGARYWRSGRLVFVVVEGVVVTVLDNRWRVCK
jgi:hypothetical protein